MMHYVAHQRPDDKWKYTVNGVPTGYCAGDFQTVWPAIRPMGYASSDEEYDRWREVVVPFASRYHSHGHATRAEAEECYKKFLLDQRMYVQDGSRATSLHRCRAAGCENYSGGYIRVGGYTLFILCTEHRNREVLEELFSVNESWES